MIAKYISLCGVAQYLGSVSLPRRWGTTIDTDHNVLGVLNELPHESEKFLLSWMELLK